MSILNQSKSEDRTIIEVATSLVDSVTHLLFSEITAGNLVVDTEQSPLKIDKLTKNNNEKEGEVSLLRNNKSKIKLQMESIDVDEHKRMMRRFISQNRKIKRQREMRSVELSEKSIKIKEEEISQKQRERSTIIEQRRKSIQERMQAKKNLLKQIRKSTLESNSVISSIHRKKFLYQQKQEEYYKKVILPKIEHENQILQKKKNLFRTPMDMNQLLEHEKNYQNLKVNSKVNRSLTLSVIKSKHLQYHPPQFVPESFKKLEEEEQNQKLQEEIKKKQVEVNQIRKKQFLKKVDELRQLERQLNKSRPQSPKKQQVKPKVKPQLDREQTKNVGNQYLRELLNSNRKMAKKLKPLYSTVSPQSPRQHKTQYEIEIIKQERIERVHKIRSKKINELMHDKNLDQNTRREKLKYEIQKLDAKAEEKLMRGNDIETINESAMILMNAIEAKIALLGVDPNKTQ